MNAQLKKSLLDCETDLDGALYRFANNDELYVSCLNAFLEDTTIQELEQTIKSEQWDEAFTAVHALKGLAGNMGFVPLFHATAEAVVLIRAGKLNDISSAVNEIKRCHKEITETIKKYTNQGGKTYESE